MSSRGLRGLTPGLGSLAPRELLDVAHRQVVGDNLARHRVRILHRQQRAGVAGGNGAVGDKTPGRLGQIQQPQRVGDMRAAFADDFRQLRLGIAKIGPKPLIAARFLDRVEILALDVLDDRQLESLAIVGLMNDHGNIGETSRVGRRANAVRQR